MTGKDNLLTLKEAAEFIRVKPSYMYKLAGQKRDIPYIRRGRVCLFKQSDLEAYIDSMPYMRSAQQIKDERHGQRQYIKRDGRRTGRREG